MITYLNPCWWRPIVSSIDLISPLYKYSLSLSHLDLKSTPKHGNSIPLPPSTAVRVDGNFHGFGDYLCSWRLFVLDTPPKTSIFGHLRVKLICWLEVKDMAGQLTCLKVKAICLIWKTMCFWRSGLITWPLWLNPLSLSFWSQLYMKQHLICDSLIQTYYISKLNKKIKWGKCWKSRRNSVFSGHR